MSRNPGDIPITIRAKVDQSVHQSFNEALRDAKQFQRGVGQLGPTVGGSFSTVLNSGEIFSARIASQAQTQAQAQRAQLQQAAVNRQRFGQTALGLSSIGFGLSQQLGFKGLNVGFAALAGPQFAALAAGATAIGEVASAVGELTTEAKAAADSLKITSGTLIDFQKQRERDLAPVGRQIQTLEALSRARLRLTERDKANLIAANELRIAGGALWEAMKIGFVNFAAEFRRGEGAGFAFAPGASFAVSSILGPSTGFNKRGTAAQAERASIIKATQDEIKEKRRALFIQANVVAAMKDEDEAKKLAIARFKEMKKALDELLEPGKADRERQAERDRNAAERKKAQEEAASRRGAEAHSKEQKRRVDALNAAAEAAGKRRVAEAARLRESIFPERGVQRRLEEAKDLLGAGSPGFRKLLEDEGRRARISELEAQIALEPQSQPFRSSISGLKEAFDRVLTGTLSSDVRKSAAAMQLEKLRDEEAQRALDQAERDRAMIDAFKSGGGLI